MRTQSTPITDTAAILFLYLPSLWNNREQTGTLLLPNHLHKSRPSFRVFFSSLSPTFHSRGRRQPFQKLRLVSPTDNVSALTDSPPGPLPHYYQHPAGRIGCPRLDCRDCLHREPSAKLRAHAIAMLSTPQSLWVLGCAFQAGEAS